MEAYNITIKKASDQLQKKFMHEGKHSERRAVNDKKYLPENPLLCWTETMLYDTKGHKSSDNR